MITLKPLALSLTLLGALAAYPCFAEVPQKAPEIATAYAEKSGWAAQKFMVAAANPLAADAGYQMLKKGGSAIDAAIATQLVLTLVEPQSSGIGGGAFLLYSTAKGVQAFDGRETAPAAADEHLFQNADGSPVSRATGVVGGRSVGAPGVLRMLELAHKEHGKLPWATLFGPAIKLAHGGFPVSQRLNGLLSWDQALKRDPVAAAYFYDQDGKPWPVGHVLKNPQLARTLREIAGGGADAFYQGRIARDIAAKVASHPSNPGKLTAADIAGYRAKVREPVCSDYKAWTVCGMPPPSSGGIAIAQMLGMLEVKDIGPYAPVDGVLDVQAIHLFSEAGRLAYADRNRYVADTDFVPLPGKGIASMLDKTYLAQRASLIGDKSMGRALPGTPPGMQVAWGMDNALQRPSTSHLVAALFASRAQMEITQVAYKGAAPAMTDVISGQVDAMFDQTNTALPQLAGERIRAIALTSDKPMPQFPGAAALGQKLLPGFETATWYGIYAPKGTPRDVVQKVYQAYTKALADKAWTDRMAAQGIRLLPADQYAPEALARHTAAEVERWRKVVNDAKIQLD